MTPVKAHFAIDPYARDLKPVTVRRGVSGEYTVRAAGSGTFSRDAWRSGGPVLDEKAKRAARDKRIDELMGVVEALHGETLAELAK
jgi:hypothetical protein